MLLLGLFFIPLKTSGYMSWSGIG